MKLQEDILSIIPQRPPFVMVDRLISCDEVSSRTTLLIKEDNVLVFNGAFTEAGLIENIAQTAAAGSGYIARQKNQPVLAGYIGAIKNLSISELPKVGDEIETFVTVEDQIFDVTVISGNIKYKGALIASCEMKIFIQKAE